MSSSTEVTRGSGGRSRSRHLKVSSFGLLLGIALVAFLPMIGALWRWGSLPPGWQHFPPSTSGHPKPPFDLTYFIACSVVGLVVVAFLLFPAPFGFRRRAVPSRRVKEGRLPWWFWGGLVLGVVSWWLHWWGPVSWARFSFLTLWWGFIVVVDGVVYHRSGGRSLLKISYRRMIAIAVVSIPAWGFFEFLNYYAIEFWVYPSNQIFSLDGQTIWALLSFSVVLPAIFEWYSLLHTFDGLRNRWSCGPKLRMFRSKRLLFFVVLAGMIALVLFGAYPSESFVVLWLAPPIVLTAALDLSGAWTPIRPIKNGNWTPVVLVGLASLICGLFWEVWNYGSLFFHGGYETNPNYWYYEIPYVDAVHLFSKMPILGYLGYLPFGFLAWVCWLIVANIYRLPRHFDLTRCQLPGDAKT
jgi:hypothetical protein